MFKKLIPVSSKRKYMSWKDKSEVKDAEMGPSEGGADDAGWAEEKSETKASSALDYISASSRTFCS